MLFACRFSRFSNTPCPSSLRQRRTPRPLISRFTCAACSRKLHLGSPFLHNGTPCSFVSLLSISSEREASCEQERTVPPFRRRQPSSQCADRRPYISCSYVRMVIVRCFIIHVHLFYDEGYKNKQDSRPCVLFPFFFGSAKTNIKKIN